MFLWIIKTNYFALAATTFFKSMCSNSRIIFIGLFRQQQFLIDRIISKYITANYFQGSFE